MKDYPLVSIITVVYNGAATIEQTIQSVINQTYQNIEYIIIDGKSIDGTQDIVSKYKDKISYFVSERDEGLYDAMNKGISHATGDVIGIINSDDWYESDAVSKVVEAFKLNEKAGLVCGNIMALEKDGRQRMFKELELDTMWYQMAVGHPTVFIRKNIYEKYGLFDLRYSVAADYELTLRLYSQKVVFHRIEDILVNFRMGGLSQSSFYECEKESCDISLKYIDMCPYKENILPMLNEKQNWLLFEGEIMNDPKMMEKLLLSYFGEQVNEIVVFGAGRWGRRCCEALLKTDLEVKFVVDNNINCEDGICGRAIKRADCLLKSDVVLIAVKDKAEVIEKQLDMLGIGEYVSISRLMEKYFSK